MPMEFSNEELQVIHDQLWMQSQPPARVVPIVMRIQRYFALAVQEKPPLKDVVSGDGRNFSEERRKANNHDDDRHKPADQS